ncbi:hypothetical protein [Neobacillus dielmonensis]|uniref:hypothetical protein n=1 Tax=Neobacillus dielmonensis TaxID=1347369 RepID=UPI0005A643DA|nr:hypothetical protein [Neobacillus dielmonensis]
MKKKLLALLTGTLLSGIMLVGCNNGDNDTNNNLRTPPQPTVDTPNNNRINNNDLDRNNNNGHMDLDNNDNVNDDGLIDNNNENNDMNTDTDKDPAKDHNTPREEIIEDDLDANDRDNKDR